MQENPFLKTAPFLPESDIAKIQTELGIVFPEEYRQHVLKYNGGCLVRCSDTASMRYR